jgi:hypothetical protein
MKTIICYSKKYGNQTALVDDAKFETINNYKWNVVQKKSKNNKSTYSEDKEKNYKFYAHTKYKIGEKIYNISMHQMIFGKVEEGFVIDHINGNSLDNTLSNLRKATYQVNAQNRKPKNKYLGASLDNTKTSKKYKCSALGKHIGYFEDEQTAAQAYDKYIIRNLGADSYLNFKYTQEEIDVIKNEVVPAKKVSELPKFIHLSSKNTFVVEFKTNNYKTNKTFKTLDDAIAFKDRCLDEIKKLETEKLKLHYKKPITKNKDGIAYILVKYKSQEHECLVDDDKWHDLSLISWYLDGEYVRGVINGKSETIHNYLFKNYYPDIDITCKKIDHINGKDEISKRLDNRMSNLRAVTASENAYNRETTNK